jgi:hypothetical protein
MLRYLIITSIFVLLSCEKDEELSKARTLWGQWQATETSVVIDNPSGTRLSSTTQNFEIVFEHTNTWFFIGQNNQDFLWAVQDDPEALLFSPELFSLDSNNILHFNTPELFYILDFSPKEIKLYNEFITKNDSLDILTRRNWTLTPN